MVNTTTIPANVFRGTVPSRRSSIEKPDVAPRALHRRCRGTPDSTLSAARRTVRRRCAPAAARYGVGGLSASLGVAICPDDAVETDQLVRQADRALY
jgi:GGDEF domain-containing protein